MCNFDTESVPKGWQWTCNRKLGVEGCTTFCSPNGKVFHSLEAVHKHNSEMEKLKIEKEMRRSMMKQETYINKVSVNNSTMLACNLCDGKFYNPSMLKKHERDVHGRSYFRKDNSNNQKVNFPYNNRDVESHLVESVFNKSIQQVPKLANSSDLKTFSASGISLSGISMNNPKADLSNVRLERKASLPLSEPVSHLSKLKDVSFSRKPKHQPLGPQIMEQYMKQPTGNDQFPGIKSNSGTQNNQVDPRKAEIWAKVKAEVERFQQPQPVPQAQSLYLHKQVDLPQPLYQHKQAHQTLPSRLGHHQSPPPIPPYQNRQSAQSTPELRKLTPVSREEMLQALDNKNEISNTKRRDVLFPTRREKEVSKVGLRRVAKKVDLKPKPIRKKKVLSPNYSSKHYITVSMACKYLGLKDYPVPVNEFNKQIFENLSNFENYFLPLVASVNLGANPLSIQTLVKAKWTEFLKSKPGEFKSIYFNKPRRNRVKVNVAVS